MGIAEGLHFWSGPGLWSMVQRGIETDRIAKSFEMKPSIGIQGGESRLIPHDVSEAPASTSIGDFSQSTVVAEVAADRLCGT